MNEKVRNFFVANKKKLIVGACVIGGAALVGGIAVLVVKTNQNLQVAEEVVEQVVPAIIEAAM